MRERSGAAPTGRLPGGRRLFRAAIVLGIGLGGFVDGIVLHQILGWHHMVCITETCRPETVEQLTRQNAQDGFFHLGMWLLTVAGVGLLLKAVAVGEVATGRVVAGGAVAGWGIFNFVEGLVDHQLLGLHHVKPDSAHWFAYDMMFLASGAVLWFAGKVMGAASPRRAVSETDPGPHRRSSAG